jgi:ubiquinone/menaquinone biosynthesis C-methylase UbiE
MYNVEMMKTGAWFRRLAWRIAPGVMQRRYVRREYDAIAKADACERGLWFMNEGYAPVDETERQPAIDKADEPFVHHMRLYWQLASAVPMQDKDVLEVGCGRGGGSYFLTKYMSPATMTGVDLSERNVALASAALPLANVSFRRGNAESLAFADSRFHVVVNIESSHLYPHPERFFREVHRVLRPRGHFLLADLGSSARMVHLPDQLRDAGFDICLARNITANVIKSIEMDQARRENVLRAIARDEQDFRRLADWGRMVGTQGYRAYCNGQDEYWSFVLQRR